VLGEFRLTVPVTVASAAGLP